MTELVSLYWSLNYTSIQKPVDDILITGYRQQVLHTEECQIHITYSIQLN